jgi:acyl-CoA thioesterase
MDEAIKKAIYEAVDREPFAQQLKLQLVALDDGFAAVEMDYVPQTMNNIHDRAHGGAIYTLIDEAFETAGQTDGTIAVALSVSVTYVSSPEPGTRLRAEAKRFGQTKKTAGYDIRVTDQDGRLIAACQALAFQTGRPLPFL